MARARNIKPSFFTSEQIADQEPLGRLLFQGMWMLADYKGDLEWKERTIKVQILPFDDCSVKALAMNLDKSGLIQFYSDGDRVLVHIPNFTKHQNPHPNERKKGSDIPAFSDKLRQVVDLTDITINRDKSCPVTDESLSDPADSPILNPDSCSLNSEDDSQDESPDKPSGKQRFTPPAFDEVQQYCLERRNSIDPRKFIDYYESTNWYRGKTKIKDWKACIRTWEGNDSRGPPKQGTVIDRLQDTTWADGVTQ